MLSHVHDIVYMHRLILSDSTCLLFICLKPHEQFFSYLAALTITGDKAADLGQCSAFRAFEQGGVFIVPTATRGFGLYGLIRKTGTHVSQWDSNPRRKDHQIFAPDALTIHDIVVMRRLVKVINTCSF
jgi:hypothetical protein